MLGGFSPFQDMFKISAYKKWHTYFWLMPTLLICLVAIKAMDRIMTPVWWLRDKIEK
jgi:hypothetical protein